MDTSALDNAGTGIGARFRRLCEMGVQMAAAEHELPVLLQRIADGAREVIGARYAALGILNANGDGLSNFVVSGLSPGERQLIGKPPTGRGILGTLIHHPTPLRLGRLQDHPDSAGFPAHHPEMHSFLGVPVSGRSGSLGNLYLTEKIGAAEFSDEDELLAVTLATQAAAAVENARLYEQTVRLLGEVRDMQRSRERFFATMNHELRNALTAVHGWADLLVRRLGPEPPRAAVEVLQSADSTLELIEDLLLLSKLEAGKLQPILKDVDAWEVVAPAASSIEPAAEKRGVVVRVTGPSGNVHCRTDPLRVRQILLNLLGNAVRHSPQDQAVDLKWGAGDDHVTFEIRNGGPAIPAEIREAIFDEYVQGDTSRERGTGLGLPLSKRLARFLGGDLWLQSADSDAVVFCARISRYLSVTND